MTFLVLSFDAFPFVLNGREYPYLGHCKTIDYFAKWEYNQLNPKYGQVFPFGGIVMKNQVVKGLGSKDIKIPNSITQSAQGLTLTEKRLVFTAVAKAGKNFADEIIITAADYAATFEMNTDEAYKQLKEAAKNLRKRYFTLHEKHRRGVMKWEINWMSKVGYEDGAGRVGLRFGEDIRPYLENLKHKFTLYKLKQAGAIRSVYSWRLLELMEQQSSGVINISVKDFCFVMEVPEAYKANFKDIRSKIIEPAIRELEKTDGWDIEVTYTKLGRKVDKITFQYAKDPQGNLF
jgi:plasmid replication initiation protein